MTRFLQTGSAPEGCVDPRIGAELDQLEDPDLDDAARDEIESHVAGCAACADELRLRDEVGAAFRERQSASASGRRPWLALAAALALCAVLYPLLRESGPTRLRLEPLLRGKGNEASSATVAVGDPFVVELRLSSGRQGALRRVELKDDRGQRLASVEKTIGGDPPALRLEFPEGLQSSGLYLLVVSDPVSSDVLSEESFAFRVLRGD